MVVKLNEQSPDQKYLGLTGTSFPLLKNVCSCETENTCLHDINRSVIPVQLRIWLVAPCVPSEVSVVTYMV